MRRFAPSVAFASLATSWLAATTMMFALASSSARADSPAAVATAALPSPADGRPRFIDLQVGYDRHYKLGCWTPVRVTISSGLPAGAAPATAVLELETADGDAVPSLYTSDPLQITAGKPVTALMYVRFGSSSPQMELSLVVDGRRVLKETVDSREDLREGFQLPLQPSERLVVCVGRSSALDEAAGRNGVPDLTVARFADSRELPVRAYGYDGVDAVVLAADDLQRYASLTPDGPQVAALAEWLQLGGRITIVGGADARLLFASPAWRKLAPIEVGEPIALPRTTALEEYAGGNKPVPAVSAAERMRVLRSTDKTDVAELSEGDLPLVVRRAVGLGVLTVSFLDLEHPQLKEWPGRPVVLARAMRLGPLQDDSARSTTSQFRSYGYNDLSGQLRGALDQYEGVAVVSFFVLAMMILLYIGLIGPFDYLLVRNVFRRTEMTWFTFPAIVVVTTGLAYYAAIWMKGSELRVSQVDVVDCDAATGLVRGTTFAGVFSPKSDTYEVGVEAPKKLLTGELTPGRTMTSWLGLSGDGFGGMHGRDGATSWFTKPYRIAPDLAELSDVPIQVWSSKMFLARWQANGAFAGTAESVWKGETTPVLREEEDGSLSGTLKSPLAVPLKGALLCYGTKAYQLPKFEVGGSYDVLRLNARDLSTELHQAEVVAAAKKEMNPGVRTRPHDPGSQEVDKIVRQMMFYGAAGGREHTSLDHKYHGFLDLSELLKLKRAVLVGYVDYAADDGAALDLTSGGSPVARRHDRRWVFVRIIVPVEKAELP